MLWAPIMKLHRDAVGGDAGIVDGAILVHLSAQLRAAELMLVFAGSG